MTDKYSILVIGDLILDETWYVDVCRKNPEAPIITAELLSSAPSSLTLGGAGLPAQIAARQGHNVTLFSSLSPQAEDLIENSNLNIDYTFRLSSETDINVTKTRYIDIQQGYHLLRLDNDRIATDPWRELDRYPHEEALIRLKKLLADGAEFDACLISDYAKGFFQGREWSLLLGLLRSKQIPSLLDSKSEMLTPWRNSFVDHDTWFKLNDKEFSDLSRFLKSSRRSSAPEMIVEDSDLTRNLLVTHGKDGASLYSNRGNGIYQSHASPQIRPPNIADPTGCGDVLDIAFITSLCKDIDLSDALQHAVNSASEFAKMSMKEKLA